MDRRLFLQKGVSFLILGGVSVIGLAAVQPQQNKKYKVIAQRCNNCGHCYRACKDKAITTKDNKAIIDRDKCKGCGDCTRFCRLMAIVEDKQTT